jgi:hypothetical protein
VVGLLKFFSVEENGLSEELRIEDDPPPEVDVRLSDIQAMVAVCQMYSTHRNILSPIP